MPAHFLAERRDFIGREERTLEAPRRRQVRYDARHCSRLVRRQLSARDRGQHRLERGGRRGGR